MDAPLQPEQATRYRMRADRGILWADYEVILCAPAHYIQGMPRLGEFDHLISFEEVARFLQIDASPRSQYRGDFLTKAATKRKNIWTREQDDATDEFWEAAYQLAVREFPILELKRPKVAKHQTWADFRPRDMPTQPKRVYIRLKGDRGYVDLTFNNTTAHEFATKVGSYPSAGMTIQQTGGSAAIRLVVPSFAIAEGLKEGLPKLRQAFIASEELIKFYREHRTMLDRATADSTPL